MVDNYSIYLVNKSASSQTFWCFLAPPQELSNNPAVFANSSASLAVVPNDPGTNQFVIPVQYVVGAGAGNQPVGLGVEIISSVTNPANIQDVWDATYATVPPNQGPAMAQDTTSSAPANAINIVTNNFDRVGNENAGWFSNQSFGIETEAGYIGMSWSPEPGQTRTLTPTLKFYVAVGDFGSNTLANWDDFSTNSAVIEVPSSFQYDKCTVTYTETGEWEVTPGVPPVLALVDNLAFFRSPAHHELMALSYLAVDAVAKDTLKAVRWNPSSSDAKDNLTYLTGTITVTTALTASFAYFVLSGISFSIDKTLNGGTTFHFSYSGPKGADAIKALFTAGAQLLFGGAGKSL